MAGPTSAVEHQALGWEIEDNRISLSSRLPFPLKAGPDDLSRSFPTSAVL